MQHRRRGLLCGMENSLGTPRLKALHACGGYFQASSRGRRARSGRLRCAGSTSGSNQGDEEHAQPYPASGHIPVSHAVPFPAQVLSGVARTLISMTDFRATQRHGLSFAPVSGRHRAPGPTGVRAQPIDLGERTKHNGPQRPGILGATRHDGSRRCLVCFQDLTAKGGRPWRQGHRRARDDDRSGGRLKASRR